MAHRDLPDWHQVADAADIPSPALLVYAERVEANLRTMVSIVGDPKRLRPHVKTHKMAEIVRMQVAQGVTKFKCATLSEAEMLGACGVSEALLAYQPVGPNVRRLVALAKLYPKTRFAALVDNLGSARSLSEAARSGGARLELVVDLDCGMGRTGIPAGEAAADLYRALATLPAVSPGGLHAYDGHIHDSDRKAREKAVKAAFAPVYALRSRLAQTGLPVPRLVVGGTPTFPIHARSEGVECSPGTCVFSDAGYASAFPDLDFPPAALVLTRVVSKPGEGRLCLDLGHKAIASENPPPRVQLLGLPDAVSVMHNEEHLLIQTARAAEFEVGDAVYGIPRHICPTVALYAEVEVIRSWRRVATWPVVARNRRIAV